MRTSAIVFLLLAAAFSLARPPRDGSQGDSVNLPQTIPDSNGVNWVIYQNGWLQIQGDNPVYSQGAVLMVGENQIGARGNRARRDSKTGELLVDLFAPQGITITRHVLVNKKENYVRYIDVLKNKQPHDQNLNLQIQSNLNYGINNAEIVNDPKKKEKQLAWIAPTETGQTAVEMFAGRNSKLSPNINWQPGNNFVQAVFQLVVPAGREIAILHVHTLCPGTEAGVKFVEGLRESKLLADVPGDLRKLIVNFSAGTSMVGDYEVLRGEMLDIVELRGGDQYRGTLLAPSYKLDTFYGSVELPAQRVVGLINVGDFRPRQLLVTVDGEIFGGKLAGDSLQLQLSSGQITSIPLSQISRVGYRKRPGEPEEWTFDKPMIVMRSGDRVRIQIPAQPIDVSTRYGRLTLSPKSIASLIFASEDSGVHEIVLADGSRFAGLVNGDNFDLTLADGGQVVKFPASSISRIQFSVLPDSIPDSYGALELTNGDHLAGQFTGQMKLNTSFDTITINGPEIKKLSHAEDAGPDIQITLWDDSTVSGQLEQPAVPLQLASGLAINVPVALINDYNQPLPQPAAAMSQKIKQMVADLSADDFAKREKAQEQLVSMGPAVLRVLRDIKSSQPPEAQQRIDAILKQLESKPDKPIGPPDSRTNDSN